MSKQSGSKGMGSHKHGISGVSPKSPKERLRMKLEAERASGEVKASPAMHNSIADLMRKREVNYGLD